MPAVRTGTRLEALQRLQRRTKHEIDSARRRDDRYELKRLADLAARIDDEIRLASAGRPRSKRVEKVLPRMHDLCVTAREVKVWAVEAGLIPAVVRGRVSGALVEAYAAAHSTHEHQELNHL
ncbi:hypothetical protein HMPREF0063_11933 [Aeromicrobium marinum DSM 15272]|uniref:Uncharacterized protein n=1 Tax=Aeromicrobium marinum DSM 15272 TaxID=585531 RepID=E2SDZ7_9ACTN|nr:hypothetical protein [Aeromicrobium marinum]EFQ82724.1 hypothetical protein HMPREF0063_11933 [Aeromicrobium marinum DSM 15272]